jgi:hypothetical protein
MDIRIICPPGPYGGVITGWLDRNHDGPLKKIVIYQRVGKGWEPCEQTAIPARLWSCRVTPSVPAATPVKEWMAMLLPESVKPGTIPVTGDAPHAVGQDLAATISIDLVVENDEFHIDGVSDPVDRWGVPVYPYVWPAPPQGRATVASGWYALTNRPVVFETAKWRLSVEAGVQHAVLRIGRENFALFNASRTSGLGTLPVEGVASMAFTTPIGLQVLSKADEPLAGVVTGLCRAYDHEALLLDDAQLEEHERLKITVWRTDAQHAGASLGTVPCQPSGYWSFDTLLPAGIVVAATTAQFDPLTREAPLKPGGDVIARTEFVAT